MQNEEPNNGGIYPERLQRALPCSALRTRKTRATKLAKLINPGVGFDDSSTAFQGQGPVQPALGDPASAGGGTGGSPGVPANPEHSGIVCDSIRLLLRFTARELQQVLIPQFCTCVR